LQSGGKQVAWLVNPEKIRNPVGCPPLSWRVKKVRRFQRRLRKRAYLAIWRRRLRLQCRCHECGGASEINPKKGKPFYYCAACREKMREWHKLVMRRRRARGLSK